MPVDECYGDVTPVDQGKRQRVRLYTASAMAEVTYHAVVWIGVVGVVPQEGCELLAPQEGAFINFLTLARSESEYRAKVSGALYAYRLDPMEFEDVRPLFGVRQPLSGDSVNRSRIGRRQEPETCSVCDVPHLSPRDVTGVNECNGDISPTIQDHC
jgi:hypothetical protein